MLCGDLNSTPETAVVEYLEQGVVSSDHRVWASVDSFRWGARLGEEGEGGGEGGATGEMGAGWERQDQGQHASFSYPTLTNPLGCLVSSAGYPKFTNYTAGFKDLLDYVFTQPHLVRTRAVAPFPTEERLKEHTALPCIDAPSDHLAVLVDLEII